MVKYIILVVSIVYLIKNFNTYRVQMKILEAISRYSIELIDAYKWNEIKVKYDDMESYFATLYRFWDWGYKNVLPKEKYEIIKPYIQ